MIAASHSAAPPATTLAYSRPGSKNTTDEEIFTILQSARQSFGVLSPEVIEGVARRQHLHMGDVLRVFGCRPVLQTPLLQNSVHVCVGKVCQRAGAERLLREVGCDTVRRRDCLGLCQFAPVGLKNGKLVRNHRKHPAA